MFCHIGKTCRYPVENLLKIGYDRLKNNTKQQINNFAGM
jgi:hypothetical protein